uniref:Uncharacterized protein n=1 Tax=Rhizophora mucronata TaxID=61149 RepID=A0A2P2JUB7_RHIMU
MPKAQQIYVKLILLRQINWIMFMKTRSLAIPVMKPFLNLWGNVL